MHLTLTELGIKKKYHMEFNEDEATAVFQGIVANLDAETVMVELTTANSPVVE